MSVVRFDRSGAHMHPKEIVHVYFDTFSLKLISIFSLVNDIKIMSKQLNIIIIT